MALIAIDQKTFQVDSLHLSDKYTGTYLGRRTPDHSKVVVGLDVHSTRVHSS